MKETFLKLVRVKTMVTFCVVGVWMTLALGHFIPADSVNNVTLMVVAFYFGTQAEKRNGNGT